jgi:hypothetical protein
MGGGKDNVTPEHVLMAAATMHDMGRLVEPSGGKAGLKMPHVTRGSGSGRKGGIKARATGGPVEADEPYLVGEKGPEIVVPKQKGTVIAMEDTKDPFNPLGGRMRPGEGGTSKGFKQLEETRSKTEQEQIKKDIKPLTRYERFDRDTSKLSRDEILQSEPLWGHARELAKERNTSFGTEFKALFNRAMRNKGKEMTDEELTDAVMQSFKSHY